MAHKAAKTVTYTLQPVPPVKTSWWAGHRHQVLPIVTLLVGISVGQHMDGTNPDHAQPTPPAHTVPADNPAPAHTP